MSAWLTRPGGRCPGPRAACDHRLRSLHCDWRIQPCEQASRPGPRLRPRWGISRPAMPLSRPTIPPSGAIRLSGEFFSDSRLTPGSGRGIKRANKARGQKTPPSQKSSPPPTGPSSTVPLFARRCFRGDPRDILGRDTSRQTIRWGAGARGRHMKVRGARSAAFSGRRPPASFAR